MVSLAHTVGYATPNQHLTRRKFPSNPQRPYAVESQITIHVDDSMRPRLLAR
ncbi:MAG: hypothetical protein SGI86_16660 [Deltaproteobacteria bacterium]|nr:hypothetical protein [Deltaproteobacteria bacterium]